MKKQQFITLYSPVGLYPKMMEQLNPIGGGADTVMCAGTAKINELVSICLTNSCLTISRKAA